MAHNPLNALKRKLEDGSVQITKRLCLAKNVVKTSYFPTVPKEKVVSEWLITIVQDNQMVGDEFRKVLDWVTVVEDLTTELKSTLIKAVVVHLQKNDINTYDIAHIATFIENPKISQQLQTQTSDYVHIVKTILLHLKEDIPNNFVLIQRFMLGFIAFYKESKKKLEFITTIVDGDNLETLFYFLDVPQCRQLALNVCENILFPIAKKPLFVLFLRTMLQKENIEEVMAEKRDNIQSVLKVMSVFFNSLEGRNNIKFLQNFIDAFVSCFRTESDVICAFYVIIVNSLNIEQDSKKATMNISFEENNQKVKRNTFLSMLNVLLQNEIDVNIRLSDNLGGNSKETKKSLIIFLQSFIASILKLDGKPDKASLKIIKTALILDPALIEPKLSDILPKLMIAKKNNTLVAYVDTMNELLSTFFKLSRGIGFLNQILPHLKLVLEASNTEQFELQQKVLECKEEGACAKMLAKIITGEDILPHECVEMFGKMSSELMSRQNTELLISLQKDFEEHCLKMLEEGFVSPSIITLCEVLSSVLCEVFRRSKMCEHTVPLQIAQQYWAAFKDFEQVISRLGKCIVKLNHNSRLTQVFLKLCTSYSELKLLNIQYSNVKLDLLSIEDTTQVFDLTILLPCLTCDEWIKINEKIRDNESRNIMYNLLLLKITATKQIAPSDITNVASETKSYLIQELANNSDILQRNTCLPNILFTDFDGEGKISKTLHEVFIQNPDTEILNHPALINNAKLLSAVAFRVLRSVTQICSMATLSKGLAKEFSMENFLKERNLTEFFESLTNCEINEDEIEAHIEVLRKLRICYLDENTQLSTIYILLAIKVSCKSKRVRRSIDHVLLSIFELSPKHPDLFKLFPIEYIFDFENRTLIDALKLRIKTSNRLLVVKCILELAVRKVKSNSEYIKIIVKTLINNQKSKKDVSNTKYFSDEVFQITCLVLPIIAKEKRAITTSNFRTILAELQEKLHKALLKSFKSVNFENEKSLLMEQSGNPEDSVVLSENAMATLNATEAFSLTLSRYCETTDTEELKNLDCLWNGLEYFVKNAIHSIKTADSKSHHVESSIQLLNVVLRHIKKLETHDVFAKKDAFLLEVWKCVKERLQMVYGNSSNSACLEDLGVTLKSLAELSSVDSFTHHYVADLFNLMILKKQLKTNDTTVLTSHRVAKHLWLSCLKANVIGPKCNSMVKSIHRTCKNLTEQLRQRCHADVNTRKSEIDVYEVEDAVCDVLKMDLDVLSAVILAAKKIPLDYKFMDAIFELLHFVNVVMGVSTLKIKCKVTWQSFFKLFEGAVSVLNSLVLSRDELLEDRWPCYMQCYRALVGVLCEKSTTQLDHDKTTEEKLAEIAHSIEKLTQLISRKKTHVSRLAAYTVGDICSSIEKTAPTRTVRPHLENSVALLIQVSDTNHAVSFLRRALATTPGHITMTNLYTMYKRYHKYVGNA